MTRSRFLHQPAAGAISTAILGSSASHAAGSKGHLIVDTHQHLWDLSTQNLPWLEGVPAILNHSYRTAEYLEDTQGLNIKTVYMEVDVALEQEAAEAQWAVDLIGSGTAPTIAAVIGGRINSPTFPDYIKPYQSNPLVKGVRQVLHVAETKPGHCLQDGFVRNVKLLGSIGKSFDLCMRATELMDGVKLAEQCPDTRFIVDHCGNPDLKAFRSPLADEERPKHTADEWRRAMEAFATRPNVICKISGIIANLQQGGDASDLAPVVNHCLDTFGPERVVFGGDWPVCLLGAPLKRWVEFLAQIIATRPAADQQKLWAENALKFYALNV